MRKVISMILMALCLIVLFDLDTVQAADKRYGDFVYTVSDKKVTITEYRGSKAIVTIPSKINGLKVTTIGAASFSNNKAIKEVKVPSSVTSVQYNAFADCSKLVTVSLPEGLQVLESGAFWECGSLKEITIPGSIETLGNAVFPYCVKLEKVTLSSGLTDIPSELFYECSSLKEVILPDKLEGIGRDAFYNCRSLKSISLPRGLTLIDDGAFYGCESLAGVKLPDSLGSLGSSAFYGCSSITSIKLPKDLTSLKYNTFYGCNRLKSITIPAALKEYDNPFTECTSLSYISVASDNETFLSENGILYNKEKTKLYFCPPAYPKAYAIPSTVTAIMEGAFASQKMLSEVTIPDGVNFLGTGAFQKAVSIKKVNLPEDTLKTIDGYSFSGSGIEELIIPEGVTALQGSFNQCSSLKSISLPASLSIIYPDESIGTFYKCTNLEKITVAEGNEYFFSEDGVLFQSKSEENTRHFILCYPAAKSGDTYTLPKDTYIGTCAFDSCKYLKSVIIPEGITSIFMLASNCRNLRVTIPDSVIYFTPEGHTSDFPLFKNCTGCYALVHKGSKCYDYCVKYKIPYKLIK